MVGNLPNFSKIDILRCFLRLDKNASRQQLAKDLELGEGTVRTILDALKSKKLLGSTKSGHFLSSKGSELLYKIRGCISAPTKLESKSLYPVHKKIGIIVKNAQILQQYYMLRDIAVKNGADGAIIFKFEYKPYIPEFGTKRGYKELEKIFDLKKGDSLVIGFSSKARYAENGALAIAVQLSDFLKKFINKF